MLCEKCKKNKAVTHVKQSINGKVSELHLCSDCATQFAGEIGYDKLFSDFGFGLESMLSSMLGQSFLERNQLESKQEKCSLCGDTISNITSSGKVGCSKCYERFYSELAPFIQRIHGKTTHNGKIPNSAGPKLKIKNQLNDLNKQLKEAINNQEFEQAALLRDQINQLKGEVE